MGNFKTTIENQKAINEAVESIFNHFKTVISYSETMETMAEAQVDLMELMELNRVIAESPSLGLDSIPTQTITTFIHEAKEAFLLLKPFAKLMGQIYGTEE